MLTHIILPMELALQNPKPPRIFMGRIFGGMIKKVLLSPKPYKKNSFTPKMLKIDTPQDFNLQKTKFLTSVNKFKKGAITDKVHPFFGEMSEEEWGQFQFKHLDHHLQQFGA